MRLKVYHLILLALFVFGVQCFAQEALKSMEEEYYDYLSLTGEVERPYISFRTFTDSSVSLKVLLR